ncbi:hypothetical protein SKAU_G00136750 [Synaphobranchus kaupii]|uniref:Ubiquitin-like protease family profile domain-containing protein n=1 Tax=Synaphobranchus kaupii TaxID=118154 RepID=A0A9Q1FRV2_SYNKA|nr:hypothetical protein SKAU_G00136750 [Synaphobranchus kaupii]
MFGRHPRTIGAIGATQMGVVFVVEEEENLEDRVTEMAEIHAKKTNVSQLKPFIRRELKEDISSPVVIDVHDLVCSNPPFTMDQENNTSCGEECEVLTILTNLRPCRTSWTSKGHHPNQEQLLSYILDENRPERELIIKDGPTCLTRQNMLTLGLSRDMDSMVGNGCLRIVSDMALLQVFTFSNSSFICGKDVFVVDLFVPPTWLPPTNCNPLIALPVDSNKKEAIVIPLWVPGHYLLCVMRPLQKEILFLDSEYKIRAGGFRSEPFRSLLRSLAQQSVPELWIEITGKDVEGLPAQTQGNDCGIFMIMFAWYTVMGAHFDFTVHDMPVLRRWWCVVLIENLQLEGHGKRFAHFKDEGRATVCANVPPVFRIPQKRTHKEITATESHDEHSYAKRKSCRKNCADAMDSCLTNGVAVPTGSIKELSKDLLQKILLEVVHDAGDSALQTLSLVCRQFRDIVGASVFKRKAHLAWLDSCVNWERHSEEFRSEYRVQYQGSV